MVTQEYMGTDGMGWGGAGWGGVVKNKFGLKCFLDAFKCYKAFFFFFFFLVENQPIADPPPLSGKFH